MHPETDVLGGVVLRAPVSGAPFRPGQRVQVAHSDDVTADARFFGGFGVVVGLVYDDPYRQFPSLPMVLVELHGEEDVFFPAELRDAPERSVRKRSDSSRRALVK